MQRFLDDTLEQLNLAARFSKVPVIEFRTDKVHCPCCRRELRVRHTDTRKVYSLHIGAFNAHRTFLFCPQCNTIFAPENFEGITPPGSNIGYDVIVYIGKLIFCEHHTLEETQQQLKNRNLSISTSEIAYLSQKFIVYLSILHQQAGALLKMHIQNNGGYILHIDGTNEGASPHLISGIDEISGFVLANVKVPGEKKEQVIPFLEKIKQSYGNPLAVTSDMGVAFLGAIPEAFPEIPNYICHFHFLRDIGKDLLDKQYSVIRSRLKYFGISSILRNRLRYYYGDDTEDIELDRLDEIIHSANHLKIGDSTTIKYLIHLLLFWALDGKNNGNGYGFPFDRPYVQFYDRLCILFEKLNNFKAKAVENKQVERIINKLTNDLRPLMNDDRCHKDFQIISEKAKVFEQLRQALAIADPDSNKGLNDKGANVNIGTLKCRVTQFVKDLKTQNDYKDNIEYEKIITQINKYWDMLFCDPITISTKDGDMVIQPQRTNNIMEQFFRDIKKSHRRTTGNNSMSKRLQTMLADLPLLKNINNQDYMRIILNGKHSLAERFAEITQSEVINKLKEAQHVECKVPHRIMKFMRKGEYMDKLLHLIAC